MQVQLIPERLAHRDHTGAEVSLFAGRHGHQLASGLPGRGAERAEELAVMHEVGAKELGDGEDPLGMADVSDHLVLEEGRELGSALGPARRAEPAPLAGKGEQVLGGAVGTADAGEAPLEDAAVEVPRDHAVEQAAPEAVAALEEVFPGPLDSLELGIEQQVERGLGRPAGPVEGGIHERRTWQTSCR